MGDARGGANDGAPEPTPFLESVIALRELFQTYVEAGFSEYQACLILGTMLAQTGRGNAEGS